MLLHARIGSAQINSLIIKPSRKSFCDKTYPKARIVRLQATVAAAAAAGKLSGPHSDTWFSPNEHDTAPTVPDISENSMKYKVAALSRPLTINSNTNNLHIHIYIYIRSSKSTRV